jgi:hypothetical protein
MTPFLGRYFLPPSPLSLSLCSPSTYAAAVSALLRPLPCFGLRNSSPSDSSCNFTASLPSSSSSPLHYSSCTFYLFLFLFSAPFTAATFSAFYFLFFYYFAGGSSSFGDSFRTSFASSVRFCAATTG